MVPVDSAKARRSLKARMAKPSASACMVTYSV
jgi:hypothetical protein